MTAPFYFSSPFSSAAHLEYTQTSFYDRSKKRKRDESSDPSDEDEPTVNAEFSVTGSTSKRRPYTSADELARGKKFEEGDRDDNDSDFPHTSFISQRIPIRSLPPSKLRRELANLNLPLHTASGGSSKETLESRQSGLKQQHLAVLTTIMHRSLMQGNYMRAGRAWGLLLRAEVKGRPMDLRSNGLWSLGAEILVQSDLQAKRTQDHHLAFTREGFGNARAYYQRLILQYPWKKWYPDSLSSLHFYPAMFALWISFVYDRHREALGALPRGSLTPSEDGINSEGTEQRHAIGTATLRSAHEIAERLDDILLSFPYSDSASLWSLRGMVARWMSDLCLTDPNEHRTVATESDNFRMPSEDEMFSGYNLRFRTRLAGYIDEERLEESKKYLEKSTKAFETAKKLGHRSGDGFEVRPLDDDAMPVE
ncbi:hypothetical protein MMC30_008628 [Trapelia coarctata]|nr:hypothetical protein [Trapelia coarctata]